MEKISIRYCLSTTDKGEKIFDLYINSQSLLLEDVQTDLLPNWTKINFQQCPNCPLDAGLSPYCPVAVNITPLVENFDILVSYDRMHVEVITEERTLSQETTTQQALGSLMGLLIATSGCPQTDFLKPMARFHLPLANEEETIFRVAATYLLGQYFLHTSKQSPDISLEGLRGIYNNIQEVNYMMGERLRSATKNDASVNALTLLDAYAQAMTFVIDESLEEIRYLFEPFLSGQVER